MIVYVAYLLRPAWNTYNDSGCAMSLSFGLFGVAFGVPFLPPAS